MIARLLFPFAGMAIAIFSIMLDAGLEVRPVSPDSPLCRSGFCRFDQLIKTLTAQAPPESGGHMRLTDLSALLNEDPANPMVWCAYGESLAAVGKAQEASAAFERALVLGPGMSPVLMKAASFDFRYGRDNEGFQLGRRVLEQTETYDQILFYYFTHSGVGTGAVLAKAVPANPRAAKAWLTSLDPFGSDDDLMTTWSWMKQNRLADQESAVNITSALLRRKSFDLAQDLWADWLGAGEKSYLHPERLTNTRFEREPSGCPFDWTIAQTPSVEVTRKNGLNVHFGGEENLEFANIHQLATVMPGNYRLTVEVSAEQITTDRGPFFHVFDFENPTRFNSQTPEFKGNMPRTKVALDFRIPVGTQVIQIQLERRASQRFDNRIAGALRVYEVSLIPVH